MKSTLTLFVFSLFLMSCTEVIFEDAQPLGASELKNIPKELQGRFTFVVNTEETVMEIGANYITGDEDKSYLSDSLIIKQLGKRYVVNKLVSGDDERSGKWEVYVLEDKGCGFVKATSFVINSDSYVDKFKSAYNATVIGDGQEKSVIVKATPDQFNNILADDSVTVSIILERLQ